MNIAKKLEWLVIIYDKPVNKRLAVRAQHLSKVLAAVALGIMTSGGAVFKDLSKLSFLGSAFTLRAESREKVLEFLRSDVYAKQDVWDFDNVVIHPYQPVFREGQDLPK